MVEDKGNLHIVQALNNTIIYLCEALGDKKLVRGPVSRLEI